MRKLLIIPALNEESKIGRVINGIPKGVVDEICLIDDGSKDRTSEIGAQSGATVIRHDVNKGVGASLRTGIDYALKNKFDIVAFISGDDQHEGVELERVISPIVDENYDFIQGSRYIEGGKIVNPTPFRFWGIKLYTLFLRLYLNWNLTDGTNGLRAFKTNLLNDQRINIWQDWLDKYELEPYLLYKVIKLGYKVKEVPITIKYHSDGSYTKMKPFKGWWSLFRPVVFLILRIRS